MSSRLQGAAGVLESDFGTWTWIGDISGDGSAAKTSQTTTSTHFTIPAGQRIAIQCDVACYVHATPKSAFDGTGSTTAVTVSSSNGRKVAAGDWVKLCLGSYQTDLSVISVSGAFNCQVFRMD